LLALASSSLLGVKKEGRPKNSAGTVHRVEASFCWGANASVQVVSATPARNRALVSEDGLMVYIFKEYAVWTRVGGNVLGIGLQHQAAVHNNEKTENNTKHDEKATNFNFHIVCDSHCDNEESHKRTRQSSFAPSYE